MTNQEKIRVIIVDDIAETRENIRKLLQFENDVEVVGVARSGREAIDISKEVKPDVVLMDINMPDMDGISATDAIRKALPFVQIVMLSVQSDSNYMRRAMMAGAIDFLTKPPTIEELNSAIKRAGTKAHTERSKIVAPPGLSGSMQGLQGSPGQLGRLGHIITVYSPKGGSGCTMLATNLAVCLNNEETSVVLVDGSLQFGDIGVFLDEQGRFSLADLAIRVDELDAEVVDNVLLRHSKSGIRILTAPIRPEYADNVTGDQFNKILSFLRQIYAYVIVDTASALNDITLNAIDASDLVLLVATQDIPSIKNIRLFLDVADAFGMDRKRALFVLNRFDKRVGITPEKVGEYLKQDVSSVIPLEDRVIVSINRGVPIILVDKARPISRAILTLTEQVRLRLSELDAENMPVKAIRNIGKKKI